MVIKRVRPLSAAKITGTLYAILGLFFGACLTLIALAGGLASNDGPSQMMGAAFGIGAIIFLPVFYGGLGFLMTLLMAWLYNVVAGMVGGIEIETA